MKTPYDAALRVADRRLDRVRRAIGEAVAEVAALQDACDQAALSIQREGCLMAQDWRLTTEHYFVKARAMQAELAARREASHSRLEELRQQAVACYGERAAIDTATANYREHAERGLAAAEQATLDDLSAALSARRMRRRAVRLAS